MEEETVFPEGIRIFARSKAPEWIVADISIKPKELLDWMRSVSPKGDDIKLQVCESKTGKLYMRLDTWKPDKDRQQSAVQQAAKEYRAPAAPPPPPAAPPPPPAATPDYTDDSIDDIPF